MSPPDRLDGDPQSPSFIVEKVGIVRSGQALQQLLNGRAHSVVHLVRASPESVASRLGQGVHLQGGIV